MPRIQTQSVSGKILLLFFISLFPGFMHNLLGQGHAISGYVTDKNNRETLLGATVYLEEAGTASVTDNNGYYCLTGISAGKYTLKVSYLGYYSFERSINIQSKRIILDEIELTPKALKLDEVSIVANLPGKVADKSVEVSHIELTPQMIKSIPTASNDVFKAIKFLPGIDRTEAFSPLYTVRGSDPGENAVLLDGVTIYNPYHSSTSSGIFNSLSIKSVDMLIGGFGAEYGGRNSSVMYITTKDGNTNALHGEIKPSTFHSQLFLEFPAGKNSSMILAGRYMFDIPRNFLFNDQTYFYDYNISYTNRLDGRNRLTLKYFESKDFNGYDFNTFYKYLGNTLHMDVYDELYLKQKNDWTNRAATAIHKMIISPRMYWRNQVYYSLHRSNNFSGTRFDLSYADEETGDTTKISWNTNSLMKSKISDLGIKTTLLFKQASFAELKIGAEYNTYHFINSVMMNDIDNGTYKLSPHLFSGFAEQKLWYNGIVIRPGLRFTNYNNTGWRYEPRINMSITLSKGFRLKAGYGKYLQYIISMNTNEIELSQIVDYYYPLQGTAPSKSTHYILGLEKSISPVLSLSIDGYYKDMERIYTFDVNQTSVEKFGFSNKLYEGNGEAYGVELMLKGKVKKVSGWVGYSFGLSNRQYPNSSINNGEKYKYEYNSPHTFKMVLSYQMTPTFTLNASFQFLSGTKRTIETTIQSYYQYDPTTNTTGYFPLYTSNGKNNAKMPPTINLDLSIEKKLKSGFGKKFADFLNADESYVSVTIRNLSFLYRNIIYYIPSSGWDLYYDKYIPLGSNYIPQVGASYTLKF